MNKKGQIPIVVLIAIGILLALSYLLIFNRGLGILVSCDDQEIISIKKVPPPLMAMMQEKVCMVNITVTDSNRIQICNNFETIYESEKGIVSCNKLEDFKSQRVNVKAEFFDLEGNSIGRDEENLEVRS